MEHKLVSSYKYIFYSIWARDKNYDIVIYFSDRFEIKIATLASDSPSHFLLVSENFSMGSH
jgi:hypothetical protein